MLARSFLLESYQLILSSALRSRYSQDNYFAKHKRLAHTQQRDEINYHKLITTTRFQNFKIGLMKELFIYPALYYYFLFL